MFSRFTLHILFLMMFRYRDSLQFLYENDGSTGYRREQEQENPEGMTQPFTGT